MDRGLSVSNFVCTFFFCFNWRKIALQCFVGFCYTTALINLSHVQLCDPTDCSTPGFHVLQHLPEFAQTHVIYAPLLSLPPTSPSLPPVFMSKSLKSIEKLKEFCIFFVQSHQFLIFHHFLSSSSPPLPLTHSMGNSLSHRSAKVGCDFWSHQMAEPCESEL